MRSPLIGIAAWIVLVYPLLSMEGAIQSKSTVYSIPISILLGLVGLFLGAVDIKKQSESLESSKAATLGVVINSAFLLFIFIGFMLALFGSV